jgi:hypothetical protein
MANRKPDAVRPQFTMGVTERFRSSLDRLTDETEMSAAELVRRAIDLYQFVWDAGLNGAILIVRYPDREVQIVMPETHTK